MNRGGGKCEHETFSESVDEASGLSKKSSQRPVPQEPQFIHRQGSLMNNTFITMILTSRPIKLMFC